MAYTILFSVLALCLLSVHALPGRLNAIEVENGSHIERNGDKISIFEPNGGNISFTMPTGPAKRDTGWITSTWTFATMTYYSAQWKVPAAPVTNAGNNIIFYFNSFESSAFNDILQPVLQFNNIIGGWSLASWYGDPSGNYYHSSASAVAPGDTILGIISLSNNVWSILGYVNGALRTTITVSYNTVGAQANGQFALEVYNIDTCSKYPPTNSIYATNILLMNGNSVVTPGWSTSVNGNSCGAGAHANSNANGVQLTWSSGSSTPGSHPGSIGIDYVGGDLVQGVAGSALECAQQCDNTPGCVGWVWGYPGSGCGGDNNKCWLKSSIGTRSSNGCRESGVSAGEAGIDRVGGDLAGMPLNLGAAATAATCASACKDNAACVSWTFNAPSCGGSTCWLKGTIPGKSSNGCRISGVKGNVGVDRVGNDIAGSNPVVLGSDATPTTCANRCASTSGCVAWAFVNPQSGCETANNCWLKNAAGSTSSSGCRISGVMG